MSSCHYSNCYNLFNVVRSFPEIRFWEHFEEFMSVLDISSKSCTYEHLRCIFKPCTYVRFGCTLKYAFLYIGVISTLYKPYVQCTSRTHILHLKRRLYVSDVHNVHFTRNYKHISCTSQISFFSVWLTKLRQICT